VERLKKRPEFLRVAAKGRKWAMPGLVLQAWHRDNGNASIAARETIAELGDRVRVGFTASKKVGGAVERNRAKRRLRAAAADVLPDCAQSCTDYVIIARAATLRRPYEMLVEDLRTAVGKIRDGHGLPSQRKAGRRPKRASGAAKRKQASGPAASKEA
jgi:ribonuclease P protein component